MTLETLTIVLALLLMLGIFMYAILDGFDLGIGNVFLIYDKKDRGRLLDIIAPLWDGNETWIVYFATVGVAAFPIVYYGILPSLYIPAILMVVGLFIRGISFEFRFKAVGKDKKIWDFTFFFGSFTASFFQGILFSQAFVGLNLVDGVYQGGALDFINPFSVVSGMLTVIAYAILGLSFIRYKTEDGIAESARNLVRPMLCASFVGTFIMEFWLLSRTPELKSYFLGSQTKVQIYALLSMLSLIMLIVALKTLKESSVHNCKTFLSTITIFAISLIKKVVIVWPYLIFPGYTIFSTANSEPALRFTFIIICIFLPIIITATAILYSIFRGKLKTSDHFYS